MAALLGIHEKRRKSCNQDQQVGTVTLLTALSAAASRALMRWHHLAAR